MHLKQKLGYMAIGAILIIAGYILAILTTGGLTTQNATAEPDNDNIIHDVIQCRELQIINKEGKTAIRLKTHRSGQGELIIYNSDLKTDGVYLNGGGLTIYNIKGIRVAHLGDIMGVACLKLSNSKGTEVAKIEALKRGGSMKINNNQSEGVSGMVASDNGGYLFVGNNVNRPVAAIGVEEYGGAMVIFTNEGDLVVGMRADKNGNGLIQSLKGAWKTH